MKIAPTILFIPADQSLLEDGIGGYRPAIAFRHKDAAQGTPWALRAANVPIPADCVRALILAWDGNPHQPGVDLLAAAIQQKANEEELPVPWHLIASGPDPLMGALNIVRCGESMGQGVAVYTDGHGFPTNRLGKPYKS